MGDNLHNMLLLSVLSQHVNNPTSGDNILDMLPTNNGLVSNVKGRFTHHSGECLLCQFSVSEICNASVTSIHTYP